MQRAELLAELERLAAEAAACRARLNEIATAVTACRARLVAETGDETRSSEEPAAASVEPPAP